MYASQLEAYQAVEKTTMSGREIEASVLVSAAIKLKQCQNNWNARERRKKLDEALKYNKLIWTIFQSELVKPENTVPKKLRESLLNLSVFIHKHTFHMMCYPSPDKLSILIHINLSIAAGLRKKPK